jgi:type II secretory pathway pseudopilin PulG
MTLIEILVATAITLLMIAALSQVFAFFSETISANRAMLELAGQIRGVALRLQKDLEGVTAPMRPWPRRSSGLGYFEYFEGRQTDYNANSPRSDTSVGDYDDIVMFTARSTGEPFVGRVRGPIVGQAAGTYATITSKVAEIIWWTQLVDLDGDGRYSTGDRFRVHRRVLLVQPSLNDSVSDALNGVAAVTVAQLMAFHNDNDLSVRRDGSGGIVANSLEDLTIRANRFAHVPVSQNPTTMRQGFPHMINNVQIGGSISVGLLNSGYAQFGNFIGEDRMLGNVLAFDVRVYDSTAPVRQDSGGFDAVVPGDPGYASGTTIGAGAFVDLNYANTLGLAGVTSTFSGTPNIRSQLYLIDRSTTPVSAIALPTYDTWSLAYERDGINQDGPLSAPAPNPLRASMIDGITDEGFNGFDDNGVNGVDDMAERETSPPYAVPLRGIQIRLRIIDPDSRQVRQMTVVSDFTPE